MKIKIGAKFEFVYGFKCVKVAGNLKLFTVLPLFKFGGKFKEIQFFTVKIGLVKIKIRAKFELAFFKDLKVAGDSKMFLFEHFSNLAGNLKFISVVTY